MGFEWSFLVYSSTLLILSMAYLERTDRNCKEMDQVDNFQLQEFAGIWYEYKTYSSENSENKVCSTYEFLPTDDNTIVVYDYWETKEVGKRLRYTLKILEPQTLPCEFLFSLRSDKRRVCPQDEVLNVLAVNYTSFAVLHRCVNAGAGRRDEVWTLSRDIVVVSDVRNAIKDALHDAHLPTTPLLRIRQRSCPPVVSCNANGNGNDNGNGDGNGTDIKKPVSRWATEKPVR